MVLMLFLASLTLIGQAVLYASRGVWRLAAQSRVQPDHFRCGSLRPSPEPSKTKEEPTEVSEEAEPEDVVPRKRVDGGKSRTGTSETTISFIRIRRRPLRNWVGAEHDVQPQRDDIDKQDRRLQQVVSGTGD